ncbi:helix-turn-helix domain-containing protein [Anaeropeptidivorans aminofermentans]|uniref:helix-turn-helix domain-containing protein n=1 Tax=Anaeropeptidivorans aminofermentans TaxID=2934315 RepID=UPI0020245BEB|nr:helix-turn-helix transcriptional regulator [Anaeropeptidivorans aminofermentans]
MDKHIFSRRLKELRIAKNLTQEQVSALIDVSRPTYSNYETGLRKPSIQIINKIADVFEISVDWLFGRTDIMVPYPRK